MIDMQKTKTWRCKKYLGWVRALPCRVNMQYGVDAHHVINVLPGVMGSKVSDLFVMPLNNEAHGFLHRNGKSTFERDTGANQAEEVLKTINAALEAGVIEIKWVG